MYIKKRAQFKFSVASGSVLTECKCNANSEKYRNSEGPSSCGEDGWESIAEKALVISEDILCLNGTTDIAKESRVAPDSLCSDIT